MKFPSTQLFPIASLLALSLAGCASAPKQEAEDPPLLDAPAEDQQAASSPEVEDAKKAIESEDFARAETILAKATAESPEDPQAAYYYGVALEHVGKKDEAAASYGRAAELQPKLLEASQNLSALLLELQRNEEALKAADAGLAVAPKDPGLLINRAYAVDLLGDPNQPNPKALEAYEVALAVAPKNANVRYYYAMALGAAGKGDAALAELGKVPLDGSEVPVVEVVSLYSQWKAFDGCVSALSSQIEKAPRVELFIHRAACKTALKDMEGAEADFRAAVEADANSADAHYYLARFLAKTGKGEEARKHLEKAAEVGGDTPAGQAAKKALEKSK